MQANHLIRKEEEAFTLIELMVVVLIIGILAAIAIPIYLTQQRLAIEATVRSDVRANVSEVERQKMSFSVDGEQLVASEGNEIFVTTAADNTYVITGVNRSIGYCYSYENRTSTYSDECTIPEGETPTAGGGSENGGNTGGGTEVIGGGGGNASESAEAAASRISIELSECFSTTPQRADHETGWRDASVQRAAEQCRDSLFPSGMQLGGFADNGSVNLHYLSASSGSSELNGGGGNTVSGYTACIIPWASGQPVNAGGSMPWERADVVYCNGERMTLEGSYSSSNQINYYGY